MLKSVSDFISLIVMIFCVALGICYLNSLANLHRSIELIKKDPGVTVFMRIWMKIMRLMIWD